TRSYNGLCSIPDVCLPPINRSGFTREYGSGGNGERLVKLASRPGPFAGEPAPTPDREGPQSGPGNLDQNPTLACT
ncbi:hypothetical protein QYE47_27115, partial [Pseudomonas sp. 2,4-D]|uniref:hypothetical protein n=1 Tax=Pseudomonas sp. 2,4-D TaxID=3058433 RepID=UPI0026319D50